MASIVGSIGRLGRRSIVSAWERRFLCTDLSFSWLVVSTGCGWSFFFGLEPDQDVMATGIIHTQPYFNWISLWFFLSFLTLVLAVIWESFSFPFFFFTKTLKFRLFILLFWLLYIFSLFTGLEKSVVRIGLLKKKWKWEKDRENENEKSNQKKRMRVSLCGMTLSSACLVVHGVPVKQHYFPSASSFSSLCNPFPRSL